VDSKGRPQPKSFVRVDRAAVRGNVLKTLKTDESGRFEWTQAPDGKLTLTPFGPDILTQVTVPATAGGPDVNVVVPAPLFIQGKITDAATGEAASRATISIYADRYSFRHTGVRLGTDGSYRVAARDGSTRYRVEIVVDGYLPADSGLMDRTGDLLHFDARITKAPPIEGIVLRHDGKSAAGAQVLFWERAMPTVENGQIPAMRAMGPVFTTDDHGKFSMPPRRGLLRLFVIHESGWCDMTIDAAAWPGKMELRAWCVVSGRVLVDGKAVAGATVTIEPVPVPNYDKVNRQVFRWTIKTDAEGRFAAERVPDGKMWISVRHTIPDASGRSRWVSGSKVMVDFKQGEVRKGVELDGSVPAAK
jgi:hypothetical protein